MSPSVALEKGSGLGELVFKSAFSDAYVEPGSELAFTLNYLKNASQEGSTDSFAFHTFDSEGFGIEKLETGLSVSSKVGRLKNISFAPVAGQQGVYQVSTIYDLKMTLDNAFDNSMRLVIEFDEDVEGYQPISDAACTIKSSTFQVADAYECQVKSSTEQITISNLVV